MEEKQWIGMGLAIMGALFWGLSGTSVQFLENAKHLNVEWLLEVRLLVAGLLTILLTYMKDGIRIFDIFKNPKDFGKLLIFGLLGIALAQYSYFKAIAISGVGVATVLQYVAPTLLIIYLFLRYFKKPSLPELYCVALAMIGTVCIIMQKGLNLSAFNGVALFWGLISAASICVYTLEPVELLKKIQYIIHRWLWDVYIWHFGVYRIPSSGIRSYLGWYDLGWIVYDYHTRYSCIL